jgi:hypothetical protein
VRPFLLVVVASLGSISAHAADSYVISMMGVGRATRGLIVETTSTARKIDLRFGGGVFSCTASVKSRESDGASAGATAHCRRRSVQGPFRKRAALTSSATGPQLRTRKMLLSGVWTQTREKQRSAHTWAAGHPMNDTSVLTPPTRPGEPRITQPSHGSEIHATERVVGIGRFKADGANCPVPVNLATDRTLGLATARTKYEALLHV